MADFDAPKLLLVGLVEMTLPSKTVRLCDGGFVYWGVNKFQSADEDFGSIESVQALDERVGDEAPGATLTFLPKSTAAAAALSQPEYQGSPMRFWLARVDEATGELDGEPELVADMELDTTRLRVGKGARALDVEMISVAERLFNVSEGNVLSGRFHKTVWPGEQGFDNATGVGITVPWGVQGAPRSSSVIGAAGGGGGGGGVKASAVLGTSFNSAATQ